MADTSASVPSKYDVWINGHGYTFLRTLDGSYLSANRHRAEYTSTPTFLERTNVSGAYGDNQQDFFLTQSQNDWSLGEAQRFFRSSDPDRVRRFWTGTNVDPVSIPGQVSMVSTAPALTFAAAVRAVAETNAGVYATSSTNLYLTDSTGAITDKSTHGLGATPSQWGLATDGINVFLSTTQASTVGVRKYNGSGYSTFSATPCDSLAFLNNTLFGYAEDTGRFIQYDTAGTATTLFTWKDAAGNALTGSTYATRLRALGGKVLLLRKVGSRRNGELWQYDSSGTSDVAEFPANFVAQDLETVQGIAFVSGYLSRNADKQPAIYYFVNGSTGLLWKSNVSGYTNATWPAMAAYGDGLVFTDDSTGKFMQYHLGVGGVRSFGSYTVTNATPMMAANKDILVHTRNATGGYYFPSTTTATTATVQTSLFDFDNSLLKQFRGVKVDWSAASDGNGGSVDVAYQVDSVDGAFTTLQTSAVSGTEYTFTAISGHTISIKVTLNKGTSTNGPVLKRIYVRAAPQLQAYKVRTYNLDLTSTTEHPTELQDGSFQTLSGNEQSVNLQTAINATSPISITDRFGTFTGICEPASCSVYELHSEGSSPTKTGQFIAQVTAREV